MLAQVEQAGARWGWEMYTVFIIPFALVAITFLLLVLLRHTLRTRYRIAVQLRDDPDINEWLIVFDWTRKVLYTPLIVVSAVGAAVMLLATRGLLPADPTARTVGGVWVGVFVLCFLIDEYEMSMKVLAVVVLCVLLAGLWLHMLGWLGAFFRAVGHVSISVNWEGFLVVAAIFAVGIVVSWIKGLFYYVAITPNYMNIQVGLTETGEQVSREDYSTRVDTGDFLERAMGFGRIVVTFRDNRRLPIQLLVGQIGKKARVLESIRGKLAVDRHPHPGEGAGDTQAT